MKALSLTIEPVDLPPAFPFVDYVFSPSPPGPSPHWENDQVLIDWQTVVMGYSFDRTFTAGGGTGTVSYALVGDQSNLPPEADLNGSTGEFTCTFSPTGSEFQAYDFHVKATDSAGNWDVLHVIIPVSVNNNGSHQGWPYLTPWATDADLEYTPSQGYEEIALYPSEYPEPVGYKELVIDQRGAHGTLSAGTCWQDVRYTPTTGFQGVDSFAYHWFYVAYDYSQQYIIGQYSTNVGQIQIQVGSWVDLTPVDPYTTDTALIGVGGSTTLTLTLQNPRADGYTDGGGFHRCPSTGYWQLDTLPSSVCVYVADGMEVLPGSKFYDTVTDADQIALTVTGAAAGQTTLSASWHVWDCVLRDTANGPVLAPGYYFYDADPATVDVVGADIEIAGLTHAVSHDPKVGGLVVRNCDGNEAPRQEITLDCVTGGWNGNLVLSENNKKVRVFTTATGDTEITFNGTDNVFATDNPFDPLPIHLYVQGDAGSVSMRDVTLTLQPHGVTRGEDFVNDTVLWVNKPTIKLKPTETVSGDDDNSNTYWWAAARGPLSQGDGTVLRWAGREGTVCKT